MQSLQKSSNPDSGILDINLEILDKLDTQAIAIGICTNLKPINGILSFLDWRLCGGIAELIKSGEITGKLNESILLSTYGRIKSPCVFIFGWGEKETLVSNFKANLQHTLDVLQKAQISDCALSLPVNLANAKDIAKLLLKEKLPLRLSGIFNPDTK
ncbi:MAG: hypothetical protein O2897_02055 [bacterium]|nr:hypothetical protein [bacterium]